MPCLESIWNFRKSCIFSWCELELDNSLKIIILAGVQFWPRKVSPRILVESVNVISWRIRDISSYNLVTRGFIFSQYVLRDKVIRSKIHRPNVTRWFLEVANLELVPNIPRSRTYLSRTSDSLLRTFVTWNLLVVPLFLAVSLVYILQAVVWPSSLKVAWFQKQ